GRLLAPVARLARSLYHHDEVLAWSETRASFTAKVDMELMSDFPGESVMSRRGFLASGAVAAGAFGLGQGRPVAAEPGEASRFPLIGFSKPFQKLDAEQTALLVATVGWDGIECPVRAKGQVEPERAADELPRFAEALRRKQRDIHLV